MRDRCALAMHDRHPQHAAASPQHSRSRAVRTLPAVQNPAGNRLVRGMSQRRHGRRLAHDGPRRHPPPAPGAKTRARALDMRIRVV